MMICKADFEDLFPHLFRPAPDTVAYRASKSPDAECIARWEDDGGRPLSADRPRVAPRRTAARQGRTEDRADWVIAATMPAAATYGAFRAMLSGLGRMTRA